MDNRNSFDFAHWAERESVAAQKSSAVMNQVVALTRSVLPSTDLFPQVRAVAEETQRRHIDLTKGYIPWRNIGFALSDGMGNQGRGYFHTLSAQNPDYDPQECDKQYDACLKAHGSGITINSLFHAAKEAGIDISAIARQFCTSQFISQTPQFEKCGEMELDTPLLRPTFSDKLPMEDWPKLLQIFFEYDRSVEYTDMMLLGSLGVLSAVVPMVVGRYRGRLYYSNFYVFIVAPPASDKGDLPLLLNWVKPVQSAIRAASDQTMAEYEQKLADYQAKKQKRGANPGVEPKKPPYKTLFVPGNSSATAMYQTMAENQETGVLLLETEADTITQACRNKEWGDFSAGLRMAFQHEAIRYRRRGDDERVDIPHPRLTIVISGTPNQVSAMIPTAEDGSFSRNAFWEMSRNLEWQDVFAEADNSLEDDIEEIGKRYFERIYMPLSKRKEALNFKLQIPQQKKFNAYFKELQTEQSSMLGDDIVATVRRLGLITFRLAMVLSVLRLVDSEDNDLTTMESLECDDRDFCIAMEMSNALISHATSVYTNLLKHPERHDSAPVEGMMLAEKQLLDKLNKKFTRPEYLDLAKAIGVNAKTADRYLSNLVNRYKLAIRIKNGEYEMLK